MNKEHDYLEPKHALAAAYGLLPIRSQLSGCSGFLSAAIASFPPAMVRTIDDYQTALKCFVFNLDGIEKLVEAFNAFLSPEDIKDVELLRAKTPNAPVKNLTELTGYVEYAILRLGQIVNPMQLDQLPPGTPGSPSFEEHYKKRTALYRTLGATIELLQKSHQFLASPVHNLALDEETRAVKFKEAKRNYLVATIQQYNDELTEVEEVIVQIKSVLAKLKAELADLDQTTLFSEAPSTVQASPGAGAPIQSPPPAADGTAKV